MHRVLSGLATQQEASDLKEWLSANPAHARTFEELSLLYQPAELPNNEESERGWIRLKSNINALIRRAQIWHRIRVVSVSLLLFSIVYFLEILPGLQINPMTNTTDQLVSSITFQQTRLPDMLNEIQTQYDLQIEFTVTQMQPCSFTGSFRKGTPVRDVLMTIAKASGTNVIFKGPSSVHFTGMCGGKTI